MPRATMSWPPKAVSVSVERRPYLPAECAPHQPMEAPASFARPGEAASPPEKPRKLDPNFLQTRHFMSLKGRPVVVTFLNGDTLTGVLRGNDTYSLLVDGELIFKHSLRSIKPK